MTQLLLRQFIQNHHILLDQDAQDMLLEQNRYLDPTWDMEPPPPPPQPPQPEYIPARRDYNLIDHMVIDVDHDDIVDDDIVDDEDSGSISISRRRACGN
jgi:hypothetical protein